MIDFLRRGRLHHMNSYLFQGSLQDSGADPICNSVKNSEEREQELILGRLLAFEFVSFEELDK